MTHETEIERYVKEPNLLVDLCQKVITRLDSDVINGEKATKEAQLREIARAINMLDKQGVPIPETLRAEKTSLAAAVEIISDTSHSLTLLINGLNAILLGCSKSTNRKKTKTHKTKGNRTSTEKQTSQSELIPYLLESLEELGGNAKCNKVLELMERKLTTRFLPGDLEYDSGFKLKWRHNAHWARLKLANDGVLKKDSPRGIWQFSEDHR